MNRTLKSLAVVFPILVNSWPAILVSAVLVWLCLRLRGRSYGELIPDHRKFGELTIFTLAAVLLIAPFWYVAVGGSFNGYLIAPW